MDIQWSQKTAFERCSRSVIRLDFSAARIVEHFAEDHRVQWAVEIGNPHDARCANPLNEWLDPTLECHRSLPGNYTSLNQIVADWMSFAASNPFCGSILTGQYPVTPL